MTESGGVPQPPGRTPHRSATRDPGGEDPPPTVLARVPPARPSEAPAREAEANVPLHSAVVMGTGLIGTSIALALRERDVRVWLADRDPASARLAADIGAGAVVGADFADLTEPADLAVLAVPPAAAGPAAEVLSLIHI